jgi:hypothetical protein
MNPVRYALLALSLLALPVQAQSALTEGPAGSASPVYARSGGITLTQSQSTQVAGAGVACANNTTGITTENLVHRVFRLAEFGVTGDIAIASVDIGVGAANAAAVTSFDTKVYIAKMSGGRALPGPFPYSSFAKVDSSTFTITTSTTDGVYPITMPNNIVFSPTDTLVVQWSIPNGTLVDETPFAVRMGGNSVGEDAPTYLGTLTSCGPLQPTPVTSLGSFANSQWVVVVNAVASSATEGGPAGATVQIGTPAPNPASRFSTVPFTLEAASDVRVAVYDVLGREVAVLAEGTYAPGAHDAHFAADALPAGAYVVRLVAGGTVVTRALTVAR